MLVDKPAGMTSHDVVQRVRRLLGTRAAGFLRSRAARALTTRSVPQLHFELDRGLEHAARIGELLNDIRREGQD